MHTTVLREKMPERLNCFAMAVFRPMRTTVATVAEPAAVAGAGILGFLSMLVGPAHLTLVILLFFFNALDLAVGGLKVIRSPIEKYDSMVMIGGVLGKILLWAVVFVAAGVEVAVVAIFELMNDGQVPLIIDPIVGSGLLTAVAMLLLIIGEGLSVLNNAAKSLGDHVKAIVFVRYFLDRIKWEEKHPQEPLPMRRPYDPLAVSVEEELRQRASSPEEPQ